MSDSNNFSGKKVFSGDQMQSRPTLLPDSGNSPVIPPHKFECRIHFLPHLWQERRAGYIYPGKKSRLFTRAKVAHVIYFAPHSTQKLMYTYPEKELYIFYNIIIILYLLLLLAKHVLAFISSELSGRVNLLSSKSHWVINRELPCFQSWWISASNTASM